MNSVNELVSLFGRCVTKFVGNLARAKLICGLASSSDSRFAFLGLMQEIVG